MQQCFGFFVSVEHEIVNLVLINIHYGIILE
jgi:hypothetical protein